MGEALAASRPKRADNPYVGPRPFMDGETIFGRDEDCEKVLRLLTGERILVLHSPSGAGKSSLINAAILPRLRKGYAPQPPLTIGRPQSAAKPGATGPEQLRAYFTHVPGQAERENAPTPVQRLLSGWNAKLKVDQRLPDDVVARCTIRDFAARALSLQGLPRFPVLVFDQFEDVFADRWKESEAVPEFFRQLGELLADREVFALIALREDYLGNLEPYRNLIPGGLRARYRLDLLSPDQAVEAVRYPAVKLRKVAFDEGDAGDLVTRFGRFVEPVLLQVVCKNMWDRLPRDAVRISAGIIPDEEQIRSAIGDFYADVVKEVARENSVGEERLREWVATGLIQGSMRAQVPCGPTGTEQDAAILDDLVKDYLIRRDPRGETTWYELSQDRLVQPILDNNFEWELRLPEKDQLLRKAAATWEQKGQSDYYLLRGRTLKVAEEWAGANRPRMTDLEIRFLERCRREHRIASRLKWLAGLAALFAIAFVVTAFVARNSTVTSQRKIDEARVTRADADRFVEEANQKVVAAKEDAEKAKTEAKNSQAQAKDAQREVQDAKRKVADLKKEHQAREEEYKRAMAEQSNLQGQLDKSLMEFNQQIEAGKTELKAQEQIAANSKADAERLNARANLRTQAAEAVANLGENTQAHALRLIAALKRGIDIHKTIEKYVLSYAVPLLLQASLNRRTLRYKAPLTGVGAGIENGRLLAVTSSGAVRFLMGEASQGDAVEEKVFRLCLDKGAMRFIASTPPEDARQGCKILSWPTAVAAGKGAEEVLVGFPSGSVFLWNWSTAKNTPVPGHRHPVVKLDFSDDAKSSASASAFWSLSVASLEDQPRRAYRRPGILDWLRISIAGGRTELARSMRFLGATGLLAIGFEDGRVELWSASRPKRFASQREHWDAVLSLASEGPGSQLLSTGRDGVTLLWKVERDPGRDPRLVKVERLRSQTGDSIVALTSAFEPSGSMFALGFANGNVQLWDARTRRALVEIQAHRGRVNAVRFLSHDLLVSTGDDGTMRTWRVPPESEMTTLGWLVQTIKAAQFPTGTAMPLSGEQARYWNSVLEKSETFLRALQGIDGGPAAVKSGP